MSIINRSLAFFTIAVLGVLSITPASARQKSSFGDIELYEAVLDRLFQTEFDAARTEHRLRYTHGGSGEMQVVILIEDRGALRIELWRVPKGALTVWEQLAALWQVQPSIKAGEAAERISIRRETKVVSRFSSLANLLSGVRRLRTPLTGEDGIFLDGSCYQFAVRSLSKNLTLSLTGPRDPLRSDEPIIRWMGRVRTAVERVVDEPKE